MPEALILSPEIMSSTAVEKELHTLGYRVKNVADFEACKEWLKLREFDLLLMHLGVNVETQRSFADLLWAKNPLAPFILFDLSKEEEGFHTKARLYGAEVAVGSKGLERIRSLCALIPPRVSASKEKCRIFVVEDLDSPRDIICTYLETLGYNNVEGFSNAQSALEALEKDPSQVACILTDIRMPQMSGDVFIKQLRTNPKYAKLPVIALTAYGTVECLVDCLKAGASGFLVKPPKRHDLVREVGRALRLFHQGGDPRLASEAEVEAIKDSLLSH